MRIVSGTARGRPLRAPRGEGTRPTSDKVRGAVFNVLGQYFDGGDVLDLYAGTGALALEALSRGCARATCVESDAEAARMIEANAAACGLADRVTVLRRRVEAALPALPEASFDLAFADPPYAIGPGAALEGLGLLLRPGGVAVAEHDEHTPPPDRVGPLALEDRRAYGGTGISIYRKDRV